VAGKVTAGLAESNGSLPPGGWLTVTCGLIACTPGSATAQRSVSSMGSLYLYLLSLLIKLIWLVEGKKGVLRMWLSRNQVPRMIITCSTILNIVILAPESYDRGSNSPVRSSVVDAERMRPGYRLMLVQCVPNSTSSLMVEWQEVCVACRNRVPLIPRASVPEQVEDPRGNWLTRFTWKNSR